MRAAPWIASSLLLLALPSAARAGTIVESHRPAHSSVPTYDEDAHQIGAHASRSHDPAPSAWESHLARSIVGGAANPPESLVGDGEVLSSVGSLNHTELVDDAELSLSLSTATPTAPYLRTITGSFLSWVMGDATARYSGAMTKEADRSSSDPDGDVATDGLVLAGLVGSGLLGPVVYQLVYDYWKGPAARIMPRSGD